MKLMVMENALNSSYYMTERRIVMIIDFHTHIFPEKIASRAIASLEQKAKMRAHVSGVEASLRASMDKSGVDLSIILPVVTNPHQFETVNRVAVETNEHTKETGLLSFGGIHPDNDNYREIIQFLAGHGCKGIKVHPVYQGVAIDDIRFLRIIDCAEEYGLVTITHAGYDIGFPGEEQSLPVHICNMLDETNRPAWFWHIWAAGMLGSGYGSHHWTRCIFRYCFFNDFSTPRGRAIVHGSVHGNDPKTWC